jgi:hypothetical protein
MSWLLWLAQKMALWTANGPQEMQRSASEEWRNIYFPFPTPPPPPVTTAAALRINKLFWV